MRYTTDTSRNATPALMLQEAETLQFYYTKERQYFHNEVYIECYSQDTWITKSAGSCLSKITEILSLTSFSVNH